MTALLKRFNNFTWISNKYFGIKGDLWWSSSRILILFPLFVCIPFPLPKNFTYLFLRLSSEVCEMSPLVNLMSYACLFDHLKSLNFTSAHWLFYSSKKIYDWAKWGSVKTGLITHDRKLFFFFFLLKLSTLPSFTEVVLSGLLLLAAFS